MKILITGATGMIGRELTKLLLSKGHTINYLTTTAEKIKESTNYKGFLWDVNKKTIDSNCFNEVEVIIHLAGAPISKRWTKSHKGEILHSRTESLDLLFDALKNKPNNVRQIVSASGIAIYPESNNVECAESFIEYDSGFLANVVKKWEASADQFSSLGINVCKLRTGMVLSKSGGVLLEISKPIRMGFGVFFGTGKQMQPWIHIRDLVAMYGFVIDKNLKGAFNAVAPTAVNNKKMTQVIADKLEKRIFLLPIPKVILKLILGEMAILLFSSKMVSCHKIREEGFFFEFKEIETALEDLLK